MNHTYMRVARIAFGILGLSSISIEIISLVNEGTFNPANFFSFFTVLSNVLAGSFLVYLGFTDDSSDKARVIRGAATLYMAMTGIIFAVLLAGLDGVRLTAVPWNNLVLHYIMPVVVVGDWLLNPPRKILPKNTIALWILFPIAYVIYTLIRGSIVSWYPYPFLNPAGSSYAQVFISSLAIAIFVLLGAFALKKYTAARAN